MRSLDTPVHATAPPTDPEDWPEPRHTPILPVLGLALLVIDLGAVTISLIMMP